MKFTHTDNTTYRIGVGPIPKPWIDYGIDDHRHNVLEYWYKNVKVWDADVCGDVTMDFVFQDGKAYRLEYGWWCNEFGEEDEDGEQPWIMDDYHIEEISIDVAKVPEKYIERDWI